MGALCFRRTAPFDPLAVRAVPKGPWAPVSGRDEGLLACDVVGTGANLIARTVFERLPRPWFHYGYEGASRDTWPGEDTSFCLKARAAGIQVWVDTSVVSPHLGEVAVDRETSLGRGLPSGNNSAGSRTRTRCGLPSGHTAGGPTRARIGGIWP